MAGPQGAVSNRVTDAGGSLCNDNVAKDVREPVRKGYSLGMGSDGFAVFWGVV